MSNWMRFLKSMGFQMALVLSSGILLYGQPSPPQAGNALDELRAQMDEMRQILNDLHQQLAGARKESQELRLEITALREELASVRVKARKPDNEVEAPATLGERIETVADDQRLLESKVNEQYETKVASGSKYRVRLSGLALLNVFGTGGSVDSIDVPNIAQHRAPGDSNGSFGATVRQSLVSLEVFGPTVAGARTSGDLKFDFFGGFPATGEGITAGIVRLRTARLAVDWKNTSIVAGQESPFFSPLSPTSLASTAYPALSYAGNLWTWTPQAYVEHRTTLSNDSRLSLQFGVLDPLTGELPAAEYNRMPTAGERSRIPGFAFRLGWQGAQYRAASVGIGGYYSRQNWGFDRIVNSWAATTDWDLPLGRRFSLSGEAYTGRAIAGLGGGIAPSVLFDGLPSFANTAALSFTSIGGWSQLKFKPLEKVEFNTAFGEDVPLLSRLGPFLFSQGANGPFVRRNAAGFTNVIYQPRSNLVLSLEYRRLWTSRFFDPLATANHVNLAAGIIF